MKKAVFKLIIFILMYSIISNINYSLCDILEKIMIPIEDGNILLINLIFNYTISLLLILDIIRILDDLCHMYVYIASRTTRKKFGKLLKKRMLKNVLYFVVIRLGVDGLFSNFFVTIDIEKFLMIYISSIMSYILWTLLAMIIFVLLQEQKKTIFIIILVIYIFQYLSLKLNIIPIISIANTLLYSHFTIIIIVKIILIFLLNKLTNLLISKVEILGGEKND